MYYYLKNGEIELANSMEEWLVWWSDFKNRMIDYTEIGGISVSTVFLGINHGSHFRGKPPVLFETMVFGGKHSDKCWRYCHYGEAKRGHWEIVDRIRNEENLSDELLFGNDNLDVEL